MEIRGDHRRVMGDHPWEVKPSCERTVAVLVPFGHERLHLAAALLQRSAEPSLQAVAVPAAGHSAGHSAST